MRRYTDIERFLDDAIMFNLENDSVTTILDVELAKEFFERLKDEYSEPHIEFCDDFENGDIFAIDKIENEDHNVSIYIYSVYDEDGEIIDLENDFVFLEMGVLEDTEVDNICFEDELIIANIDNVDEYDFTEELDKKCECNSCNCGNCQCEIEKDECFEDLIERFVGEILSSEGCPVCIEEALYEFADAVREFDDKEIKEENMDSEIDVVALEVVNCIADIWEDINTQEAKILSKLFAGEKDKTKFKIYMDKLVIK